MNIGLFNIDYKSAALNQLEQLYFKKEQIPEFLKKVQENSTISEMVVLSTCNRVELYYRAPNLSEAKHWLADFLTTQKMISNDVIQVASSDTNTPKDIIWHLFRVASGIESMVFGDGEILAQVKNAYDTSAKIGMTQPAFNKLFQSAIAAGKRVRSETDIAKGAYSVSSIAVEAIKKHFDSQLTGKNILIVGTGTMGMRALKKLAAIGQANIWIANRSHSGLQRLAEKYNAKAVNMDDLNQTLEIVDAVIWATSSDTYLVSKKEMSQMATPPQIMIDIGIPRNVNPDIEEIETIKLVTIYGLQKIADETIENRKAQLEAVNHILKDEFEKLNNWHQNRSAQTPQLQCQK